MDNKICTHCKKEKHIGDFYNKYTECRVCKSNRSLIRYYENREKKSYQKKYVL